MKHLKRFNESNDNKINTWEDITIYLDVYELYALLKYTYGNDFLPDTQEALIEDGDSDENPDHIYDVIEFELEDKDMLLNFCKNFEHYVSKKDRNPSNFGGRQKEIDSIINGSGKEKANKPPHPKAPKLVKSNKPKHPRKKKKWTKLAQKGDLAKALG